MASQYANETSETHTEATSSVNSNDESLSNDTALGEGGGQASRDTMASQNANGISETQAREATSSTSANNASPFNAIIVEHDVQARRQLILQKIPQRKNHVYNWSHNKKLCKLAIYSACQVPQCPCTAWKLPAPAVFIPSHNSHRVVAREPCANFSDPCRTCNHQLEKHVTQLLGESDYEINRLLGAVVDIENLYLSMRLEDDVVLKRVFYYLFKCLYKCITTRTSKRPPESLGPTGVERPSIAKAVSNFMLYKLHELDDAEWEIMYELAEMFLKCIDELDLQVPSEREAELRAKSPTITIDVRYERNYSRWLMACFIPRYCDSLPAYAPTAVFGPCYLRFVFRTAALRLAHRSQAPDVPPHKRELYWRQGPEFLALLELETFSNTSPIWNPQFHRLIDYENDMIEELYRLIPPR